MRPLIPDPGFEHIDDELCRSFQVNLELVGRKWNSGILLAGVRGAVRFSEYRALVMGVSDRLLAQRFKELETAGLMDRRVIPTTPVSIEYRPTERGRELLRSLQPLITWGIEARGN